MPLTVPAAPAFGDPVPPSPPSAETLALLARRRSTPAQGLTGPGPGRQEVEDLLRLAARVPDHGKLFPWRFAVYGPDAKSALAEALRPLAQGQPDPAKATAVLAKLTAAPVTIAIVSRPVVPSKISQWEQILSAGAAAMTLLIAAEAMGYGANWITDWYAYDEEARRLFGIGEGETVAAFVHIGTRPEPSLERVRPDLAPLTDWRL